MSHSRLGDLVARLFIGMALSFVVSCAAVEASRRMPGTISQGRFTPARPASASYGPDSSRTCPAGGPLPVIVSTLEKQSKTGGKRAEQEGRLCAIAESFLGWEQAGPPDESVARFASSYFGLSGALPRVITATLETEDPKLLADRLVVTIEGFSRTATQPRFGLATSRLGKGSTKVVLVLQDQTVELDPLPRRLAPNTQATLSGRLVGAYAEGKVLVCDPAGKLKTSAIASDKAFRTELRCADQPGRIQVEIRGEDQGSFSILSSFAVACGTDAPTSVAVPAPSAGQPDVATEEKKLLDLINEERSSAHIPPLAPDSAVAGVARTISDGRRDEAQRGTPVSDVDVAQKLKQADIASPVILQNPAQARTAEQAQMRFSNSPVHRSNFLSQEVTHAGIGIATGSDAEGKPSVVVTELFVKELPSVDANALRTQLRAAIAKKRSDARAAPVGKDPLLDELAQTYAKELAAAKGALPKARGDAIVAPLYKSFRSVNIVSGAKADPLEFAEESSMVANAKLLGLGVAQGANPVLGKNAVYVVALLGTRR